MTVEPITKPVRAKPAANDGPTAPHVYQAIADVMGRLAQEGIGKNQKNAQQGFKFRGIDDVYNALATILASERLCVLPRVVSREITERQTKNGGVLFCVVVNAEFDFVSAIDGSKHTVGPFPGEAMDSGDKATNKAMSAAYKYMALETFCIPTEGDNDADATTHEVAPSAAGGESPSPPAPRQQPSTNASQAKKADVWPRFVEKLRSFTDLDELERWWSSASTQSAVDAMPGQWPEQAHEEYEKKQEALMGAGAP